MKFRKLLLSLLAPALFFGVVSCDNKEVPGSSGPQGEIGEQGETGTPGNTPYIKDDTWWIGTTNTMIPATGPKGDKGEDNLNSPYIKDGTWWIGEVNTNINATGSKGETGDKGQDGMNGTDGKDGQNGTNGTDGKDGVDGNTPYIKDGTWWIGETNTNVQATGPQGEKGEVGDDSDLVNPTKPGLTPYIKDGTWWIGETDTKIAVTGSKGETGDKGQDGTNGTNGTDGNDGNTPYIKDGYWWVENTNTNIPATGDKGETGDTNLNNGTDGNTPYIKEGTWWIGEVNTNVPVTGNNGSDGSNGKDGLPGEKGETGETGEPGQNGENGKSYYELYKDIYGYASSESDFYVDLSRHTLGTKKEHQISIGVLDGNYNCYRSKEELIASVKPSITYYTFEQTYKNGEKVSLDKSLGVPEGMSLYEMEDGRPGTKVDITSYRAYKDVELCFAKKYRYELAIDYLDSLTYEDGKYYLYTSQTVKEYKIFLYDTVERKVMNIKDFSKLNYETELPSTKINFEEYYDRINIEFGDVGRQRITVNYEGALPVVIDFDVTDLVDIVPKIDGRINDYFKYNQEHSIEMVGKKLDGTYRELTAQEKQMLTYKVVTELNKEDYTVDLVNGKINCNKIGELYLDISFGDYFGAYHTLYFGTSDDYISRIDISRLAKVLATPSKPGSKIALDVDVYNGLNETVSTIKALFDNRFDMVIEDENIAKLDKKSQLINILKLGSTSGYFITESGKKLEGTDFVIKCEETGKQTLTINVPENVQILLYEGKNSNTGTRVDPTSVDANNRHFYSGISTDMDYSIRLMNDIQSLGIFDCDLIYNGKLMHFSGSGYCFYFKVVAGVTDVTINLKENKEWYNYSSSNDFAKDLSSKINATNQVLETPLVLPQGTFSSLFTLGDMDQKLLKIKASYNNMIESNYFYVTVNVVPDSSISQYYFQYLMYENLRHAGFIKAEIEGYDPLKENPGYYNETSGEFYFPTSLSNDSVEEGIKLRLMILKKEFCSNMVPVTEDYTYDDTQISKITGKVSTAIENQLNPLLQTNNVKINGQSKVDLSVLDSLFGTHYQNMYTVNEAADFYNRKAMTIIYSRLANAFHTYVDFVKYASKPISEGGLGFRQCRTKMTYDEDCLYLESLNLILYVQETYNPFEEWSFIIILIDDADNVPENIIYKDFF